MEPETRRLFVALRPPEKVIDGLILIQEGLQESIEASRHRNEGRVRWIREDQMHLTLVFASAFPESRIEALETALADSCAACAPFKIEFGAPETRPSHRDPKVIWTPVADDDMEALRSFQSGLSRNFKNLRTDIEDVASRSRRFLPHITLGRVARGSSRGFARAIRDAVSGDLPPAGSWDPLHAELLESRLGTSGASHTILRIFPLKEGN